MAAASLIWPSSLDSSNEIRLIIACIAGSFIAFLGRRMRSRAQILQIAVFIPFGALLGLNQIEDKIILNNNNNETIQITKIQEEGKKILNVKEYLKGNKL